MPRVAWDNAAHSLLERTLDDSANRRTILPEAFLIADELIARATRIVDGLRVDDWRANACSATYGPFAATERLLMELARRGADRQAMHEVIREHSMAAWGVVQQGGANPLIDTLSADPRLTSYAEPRAVGRVAGCERLRGRCAGTGPHVGKDDPGASRSSGPAATKGKRPGG